MTKERVDKVLLQKKQSTKKRRETKKTSMCFFDNWRTLMNQIEIIDAITFTMEHWRVADTGQTVYRKSIKQRGQQIADNILVFWQLEYVLYQIVN